MAQGESKEANYDVVLDQIVKRLQDQLKDCNEVNCYFALDPDDLASNPADHIYVVAPVSGQFRLGAFEGGANSFVATNAGCIVKIHCPTLVDQRKRDAFAIMGESTGVLRKASAVLKALGPSKHNGNGIPSAGWVPILSGVNLTSPFVPVDYSIHKHENNAIRSIELRFSFEFDWDTTQSQ